MTKPNLYRYPEHNDLFSAHTFAERQGISIGKARRIIAKKLASKEIEWYYKQKENIRSKDERTITI